MRRRRGGRPAAFLLAAVLSGCVVEIKLPDRYAIVYGIADYGGPNNLNYSDDDGTEFAALLAAKGWEVVHRASVTPALLDADFTWAEAQTDRDSQFLFFFSGHGAPGVQSGGSEPEGADDVDEFIFLSDGGGIYPVSDDQLSTRLARVHSRLKIVIIDACNSGGFIGESFGIDLIPPQYGGNMGGAPFSGLADAFARYFARPGDADISFDEATVMTAAGEEELSFETPDLGNGVFTYYLLKSAGKGDSNGDGYITVTEAYGYIRKNIDVNWNRGLSSDSARHYVYFLPRVSGGPIDPVLFEAD